MSQSEKIIAKQGPMDGKALKRRRSIWSVLFRVVLAVVLIVLIVGVLIWFNRYSIFESMARREFAKIGIDGNLHVQSISKTEAVISKIKLSADGQPFLSAGEARFSYDLDNVLDGVFNQINVRDADVYLTLDANGKIIDGWMPQSSTGGDGFNIPAEGIHLKSSNLHIEAPNYRGDITLDADILSASDMSLNISAAQGYINADKLQTKLGFIGKINTVSSDTIAVKGDFTASDINSPYLRIEPIRTSIDAQFSRDLTAEALTVNADFDLDSQAISMAEYGLESVNAKISTSISIDQQTRALKFFSADWQGDMTGIAISDLQTRRNIVRNLISYNALRNTPIIQHFVGPIADKGEALLAGFNLNGNWRLHYANGRAKFYVDDITTLSASGQALTIAGGGGNPQASYDTQTKAIKIDADLDWQGFRPLTIDDFKISAIWDSDNRTPRLSATSARINSAKTWRSNTKKGPAMLMPYNVAIDYRKIGSVSRVDLTNRQVGLTYSGPMPGANVEQMQIFGAANIRTNPDGFSIGYTPSAPVKIKGLETASEWRGEDLQFSVTPQADILQKQGRKRPVSTILNNLTGTIIGPDPQQNMNINVQALQISTDLSATDTKWELGFTDTEMNSGTFPAPGTTVIARAAHLGVMIAENGDISFTGGSPNLSIETNNALIKGLAAELDGTPSDFTAKYSTKSVAFKTGEIPVLPMFGTARFARGALSGKATAYLPKTKDTPIYIDFSSEDGRGKADVSIPKIVFSPKGLQPQYLIPTLRGRLAEVKGQASADFTFTFGGDAPITSRGFATITDMDLGTLVGPFTGVNTELTFNSIFPLQTQGSQTAVVAGFDPGFPLKDGVIKFEIIPTGIRIEKAEWPVANISSGDGRIFIEPLVWTFGDVQNAAKVRIENLSLGTVVAAIGQKNILATGQINGELPVRVKGVDVLVDQGVISIADGGLIQFKSPATDAAAATNETAGFAFKALENFEYESLEARLNGPLGGDMLLRLKFTGQNEEVLGGAKFKYNIGIEGELANIIRNTANAFSTQENLRKLLDLQEDMIKTPAK